MALANNRRRQSSGAAQEIMTLREVADFLRCHPALVYRLVSCGDLPAFKLIGEWRFRRRDVERWLDQRSNQRQTKLPSRRSSHSAPLG